MIDVVHLPPESTYNADDQPVDIMVQAIADLIGGSDSPEDRARAIVYLDRAADWLNGAGIYMYRRKTKIYTSAVGDFSTGDTTLELPTDWAWPSDGGGCFNGGQLKSVPEWLDWHIFQNQVTKSHNAMPKFFSIRSEMDDQIFLWPYPDTSVVDEIKIQYFARVQRPSESPDLLYSPETREALLCGGEAFALRHRYASKPAIWNPFWKQFERAMAQARISAWRYRQAVHTNARPDETGLVAATAPSGTQGRGVIFVAT